MARSAADANPLGDFLRARRALLNPADFSLPDVGMRRVPGLRRDEVAFLAGVSSHYYARLEQGRDRNPSDAVLDALAGVFGLDDTAADLLRRLARPLPVRRRRRSAPETVDPGLAAVLDTWAQPAAIVGRYRDVLAANALAQLVNPGFRPGRNLLRDAFLESDAPDIYPDWHDVAAGAVAGVRASAGDDPGDPRLRELIGELSIESEAFRTMWARHDVRERGRGVKRYRTALAGPITLRYETLRVAAAPGQTLFLFHAVPDSADARTLALLNAMVPGRSGGSDPQPVDEHARP